MKFTKTNIKKFNKQAIKENDGLLESVTEYILDKFDEYNDPKTIVTECLEHGCVSGIVGSLIYYSDTTAFYDKNKEKINELLYDVMEECGIYNLNELFGHGDVKWDEEDPLALDYYNKNILAWFGFEECMRRFAGNFEELEELI